MSVHDFSIKIRPASQFADYSSYRSFAIYIQTDNQKHDVGYFGLEPSTGSVKFNLFEEVIKKFHLDQLFFKTFVMAYIKVNYKIKKPYEVEHFYQKV